MRIDAGAIYGGLGGNAPEQVVPMECQPPVGKGGNTAVLPAYKQSSIPSPLKEGIYDCLCFFLCAYRHICSRDFRRRMI